jgi:fructose-1,6-bisphosphatase
MMMMIGLHGSGGDTNVQGEVQKVMDVLANNILAASMCAPGKMDYVASEEEEEPTYCSTVLQNAAFR